MIIRTLHRRNYTSIANQLLEDDRLSYRARGVMAALLAKPNDWRIDSNSLARAGSEGRDAVRTAIAELEEHGYLVRTVIRGDRGRFITVVDIVECPQCEDQASHEERPGRTGAWKSGVGPPGVGPPGVGNPGALLSTQTKDADQALTSSDHQLGYAANGCNEDDQDPQPPDWIGGAR